MNVERPLREKEVEKLSVEVVRELAPRNKSQNSLCPLKLIETDRDIHEIRSTDGSQMKLESDNSNLESVDKVTEIEIDVTKDENIEITDVKETRIMEATIVAQVNVEKLMNTEKASPIEVVIEGDIEAENKVRRLNDIKLIPEKSKIVENDKIEVLGGKTEATEVEIKELKDRSEVEKDAKSTVK